jgi:hypothetical protein
LFAVLLTLIGCGSSPGSVRIDAGRDAQEEPATDGPPGRAEIDVGAMVDGPDRDGAPDAYTPRESRRLGMNDVSMLVPLPAHSGTPTLAAMTGLEAGVELVPRDLFHRLVDAPGDVMEPFERFHVVAVRFDLCDRVAAGPCPADTDGRLRLVLQPLHDTPVVVARDVALHAFYPIPAQDLGAVVDELRALAAIQDAPLTAPLGIHPTLSSPERAPYVARLRTLIARYAAGPKLARLTLFAQHAIFSALNWAFRGVERQGGELKDMVIPDVRATEQRTILVGAASYDTQPAADVPAGLALALDGAGFSVATQSARLQSLGALAEVLNPIKRSAETVQCAACHVATVLTQRRSSVAAVDPATIPGRYASPYNLSNTTGIAPTNERSLRAFGWLLAQPAISQRVINETAQVLSEIEARFPPAAP